MRAPWKPHLVDMGASANVDDTGRTSVVWLTAVAWLSLIVFAATSTLMSVSLKSIGTDLEVGYGMRGTLALARAFVLAGSTFILGICADRIGKRPLLAVGMFVVAVGLVCVRLTDGLTGLVGGTMVIGLGLGSVEALVSPLVADLHPDNVDRQMNVLHGFFPAGVVLASLLIGRQLDSGVHWRVPFGVVALPAVLVGVMYALGRYPESAAERKVVPISVLQVLRQPIFWALAAAMMLTAGCEGSLIYWSPNFIQDTYGAMAYVAAWGLTIFTGAMAGGRFLTGYATRYVRPSRIMLVTAALGVVTTLLLSLVPHLAFSMVMLGLSGLFMACFWPSVLAVANRRIAAGSATLLAMLSVAGIAGFGLIPYLIGTLSDHVGLRLGLLVIPVGLVLAGIALAAVVLMDRDRDEVVPNSAQ